MRYRLTDLFWVFFGRHLVKPPIIAVLGGALLFGSFNLLTPNADNLVSMRRKLAERVAAEVIADLPKKERAPTLAALAVSSIYNYCIANLIEEMQH
jgi:hypothetical protein